MNAERVYVNADGKADLVCPHCGIRRTINAAKYQNREGAVKVRCMCRLSFRVFFESRKADRDETYLEGYYGKLPGFQEWGKILVQNISPLGMGFATLTKHNLKEGDKIRVAITANNIYLAVAIFTLTIFIQVTYACNEYAIIQRIVPRQNLAAGVGFYNGICMLLGGAIGPVIVGQVLAATGSYTSAILSISFLCVLGGVFMIILGKMIDY